MNDARRLIVNDTIHDTEVCWEYPDGSHRCVTSTDASWLNEAVDMLSKAEADYRGMAGVYSTYGFRASAKEAEETADYLKAFLERKPA